MAARDPEARLTIVPFDSIEEAVSIGNDTEFGLNPGIFITNVSSANLFARRACAPAQFGSTAGRWSIRACGAA